MSKVVVPKHSADTDEMNAVLKIHYEAGDWVDGRTFKERLMRIIGANQYPSSYPKKAQVPAYFGFLESKVSAAGRIQERKISESGKMMYEAIINDDIATRQRLILEALEKIVFGRNNAGCTSSNSDIEAPAILVKCILDTGYCTCAEYAYLVWSLDNGGKYYASLDEIIKARSAGGIAINQEATEYKDWKPVLAMQRWGFLVRSDDDTQKLLFHQDVIDNYPERLEKIRVYNIDKSNAEDEVDFDEIDVSGDNSENSYKPFRVDIEDISTISSGHFLQQCTDVEEQRIRIGDQVLLVDRDITHLVAYYSYLIRSLDKVGEEYNVGISRQFAVNIGKEQELIAGLRAEEQKPNGSSIKDILLSLSRYDDYDIHLKLNGKTNKDILPAYLIVRALLDLKRMSQKEMDYLVYSIVDENETYTDVVETIIKSRRQQDLTYKEEMQNFAMLPSVQQFRDKGILKVFLNDGVQWVAINPLLSENYPNTLKRLSFYAVDIQKHIKQGSEQQNLPQVIKAIKIVNNILISKDKGNLKVLENQIIGKKVVQGDFVVFVDDEIGHIQSWYVYQILACKTNKCEYEIDYIRRHVINRSREQEIISMVMEER